MFEYLDHWWNKNWRKELNSFKWSLFVQSIFFLSFNDLDIFIACLIDYIFHIIYIYLIKYYLDTNK